MRNLRNYKLALLLAGCIMLAPLTACGPQNVRTLKVDLAKTADALNTAAKTNHALYEAHEISLDVRKKVATGIYDANEVLLVAIETAKGMTKDTFAGSRAQILALLSTASSKLAAINIGNPKIDLIIQSIIALINSATAFASAMKSADLQKVDFPAELRSLSSSLHHTQIMLMRDFTEAAMEGAY